ncbi:hypothetical protein HYT02_01540 [Candidatus Gottesmanbacteria bacterium]|nr:hypothetical protein [Candidatus Gottesmanbacteria bacterium]
MMPSINPALIYRLQSLLNSGNKVLIALPENPSQDAIASGLALFLSLTQKGKEVRIVSPSKITIAVASLFAVDKITDQLGQAGKNLVISFPYVEGSIEKVSYNIQNNKFNLVIEPRGEAGLLDKNAVEFSRGGEGSDNFDIIFYIDVANLDSLGKLSQIISKLAVEKPTISFSTQNSQFPVAMKFGLPTNGSIAEIVALVLSRMGLPFDPDIADNLIKGIKEKTNNFSQNSTPDTFEAVAICMRKQQQQHGIPKPVQTARDSGVTMQIPKTQTPPDWLKPKIFRSSDTGWGGQDKGTIL